MNPVPTSLLADDLATAPSGPVYQKGHVLQFDLNFVIFSLGSKLLNISKIIKAFTKEPLF